MKIQFLSGSPPNVQSNMSQSLIDTAGRSSECKGASAAVIDAVASAEGVDAMALDVPLYEAIDPDALDDLVASSPGNHLASPVRICFTYYGYEVAVYGDGEVTLNQQ